MSYTKVTKRKSWLRWSPEADRKLRALYSDGDYISVIARALNVTSSAVRNRVHTLALKRNFYRRPLLDREKEVIREKYPNTSTRDLARELGRTPAAVYRAACKLGLQKSAEYMQTEGGRIQKGSRVGATHRFLPGNVPVNKGIRRPGWSPGRMKETQFKKGERSRNYLPIGTIKKDFYGYLRIKIADGLGGSGNQKVWAFVHRQVWEGAHGPIPPGHRIWWKDRNHENCALENLELLTDKEHMRRTTVHNLPAELKDTIMLAGRLKRRIRRRERDEEQTLRSAKSPI